MTAVNRSRSLTSNDHEPLEESEKTRLWLANKIKRVYHKQVLSKSKNREHVNLILTGHLCTNQSYTTQNH